MTKYQLVPYIVRVNVRGDAKETRPLDDLDASGTLDLATELGGLLSAHLGKTVKRASSGRLQRLRVLSVGTGDRSLNWVCAPGRSGIESETEKADGSGTSVREFEDIDYVRHYHYLMYRQGSHRAVLLAERIAGDGMISTLRQLITQLWNDRHPELVISINPAADEKIWETVLVNRPVIKYQMTKTTTTDGRLAVSDAPAEFEMNVKPPGRGARFSLKASRQKSQQEDRSLREILLEEVTPVLAPGYEEPAEGAAALMEEGWSVAVQLELESGHKPIVNVESNTSITLTFPVIDGQEEPAERPTQDDVLAAVKRLIKDGVFDKHGFSKAHSAGLKWVTDPGQPNGEPWEVAWDVDTDAASTAPGST